MRRIVMMVLRNILLVPYMWIRLCYHAAHADDYTEAEHFKLLKFIVRRANKGGNVNIESHGVENIPKENGFMMYPNHQGMYDVLALVNESPVPFSVVAKQELKDVPFVREVFKCMKAYTIDREDIRQSMRVILAVTNEVKHGRNYLIFPEGTRSKNGNKIGHFKGGSFKAATKAKCPIVPVALIDSFKPFDSKSLKQATVQVHFLEPLYYEDYKDMNTNEIAEYCEKKIQETIDNNISE